MFYRISSETDYTTGLIGVDVVHETHRSDRRLVRGDRYKGAIFTSLFGAKGKREVEGLTQYQDMNVNRTFIYHYRNSVTLGRNEYDYLAERSEHGVLLDIFRFPPDMMGITGALLVLRKEHQFLVAGISSHVAVDRRHADDHSQKFIDSLGDYGTFELQPAESGIAFLHGNVATRRLSPSIVEIPEFGVAVNHNELIVGDPIYTARV